MVAIAEALQNFFWHKFQHCLLTYYFDLIFVSQGLGSLLN